MHTAFSKIFFFLVFILCSLVGVCQNADDVDFQTWTDYNLVVNTNNKFYYGGDAGIRGLISNEDWNLLYIRPYGQYFFNSIFNVKTGFGSFNTLTPGENNAYEVRLFQDLNVRWPDLNYVEFFYRIRFEERWFYNESLPNENQIRSRLMLGFETADFKLFSKGRIFYSRFSWEGFKPLKEPDAFEVFVNQSRLTVIMGHRVTKKFHYEIHFISQRSRLDTNSGLENTQNIFRLRFYHLI